MSKKLRHTKIKNTGVLFEVLTRQVTADIIDGTEFVCNPNDYVAYKINIPKDIQIGSLNILTTESYKSRSKAERLIDVVIKTRQRISNKVLRSEKYNLIKAIKEAYDVKALFSTKMPNYKKLASIYKLFLYETTGEDINPTEVVDSREFVVESLIVERSKPEEKSELIREYNSEDTDVKLMAYTLMVEKFNEKYNKLSQSQKNVLRKYINNVSNTNSLTEFIDGEVINIRGTLKKLLPTVKDDITSIKLREVTEQVGKFSGRNEATENKVVTLMRYYELIKELENVTGKVKNLHS